MFRKIISLVTLIYFISYLYGCSSIEVVELNESNIEDVKDSDIVSVVTKDNKIYEFEKEGIKPKLEFKNNVLIGWAIGEITRGGYKISKVTIPVSDIKTIAIPDTNYFAGGLISIGILAGIFTLLIVLTFDFQL